jgi:(S)-mandelate dehydrogenase
MIVNIDDHRRRARRRLPRFVFDFIDGGAGDEACIRRNREALDAVTLTPRCLRDVSAVDTGVTLLGRRWSMPLAVAPTGFNGLIRPDADLALARAAAAAGVPFVLSTAANARLERVAEVADGMSWLQLYMMTERSITRQMVARARRAGIGALVLTVDVPVSGRRERDLRHGFRLPFRPPPATVLDICRHPLWLARMALAGMPGFPNLSEDETARRSPELDARLLGRALDRTLDWGALDWLRDQWDGPLLLKGVLHPEDAALAVERGIDGIIVSNHGGRQLDIAPASVAMLPGVAGAVAGRVPVLVDGGLRRGGDIARALALGADAVLAGRPLLYGLASDGERGARSVLATFAEELDNVMTLLGASTVGELRAFLPEAAI